MSLRLGDYDQIRSHRNRIPNVAQYDVLISIVRKWNIVLICDKKNNSMLCEKELFPLSNYECP